MNKFRAIIFAITLVIASAIIIFVFTNHFNLNLNLKEQNQSSQNNENEEETNTNQNNSGDQELPIYITTMTHYEGGWKNIDKGFFDRIIERSEFFMDLADEYNAKLTFESEKPFAIACREYNRNFLKEIVERGHGVGTHFDYGFKNSTNDLNQYIKLAKKNKALIDKLVGKKNNLGISGGGTSLDWVTGMYKAGFSYADGIVGVHYLSMPESARPAGWDDDYIYETGYHYEAPLNLNDRIYPRWLADANDFQEDANGKLAVMTGDLGRLSLMAEGRNADCVKTDSCPLTKEDVDVVISEIKKIIKMRDPQKFTKIGFYFATNDLVEENEDVLRYFF
ncbi:hypothetical protein D6827_03080, partial [Candidatus Parcubacteria bacterium]